MVTVTFLEQFTVLTILFLLIYVLGARRGVLIASRFDVMLMKILRKVILISLTVLALLFVMKAAGFADPFSAERAFVLAVDLVAWWVVCRLYIRRAASN